MKIYTPSYTYREHTPNWHSVSSKSKEFGKLTFYAESKEKVMRKFNDYIKECNQERRQYVSR